MNPLRLPSRPLVSNRRAALRWGTSLAASVACPAWLSSAIAAPRAPTPGQAEGPFYPQQWPIDQDGDLLRNGNRFYGRGAVAWVEGPVLDLDGHPVRGAQVEIWQCDADGHYHHPADGGRADPAFQGAGRVTVGPDGRFRFRTLRPVAYRGRTPHIHVKVRLGSMELLTTQLYVEGDPDNERDFLWRRLSTEQRRAVTVAFRPDGSAVRAEFPIVVVA